VVVGGTSAQATRAFRWTAREGLQDLGSLPGGSEVDYAEAFGINHWGTIVGATQLPDGPGRAFVWTRRSGMRDLNELIDPSSTLGAHIVLRRASAINDAGWIAAGGVDIRDGVSPERGFLLAPRRHPGMPGCR
jgi:probable HAF family extracellular repeat protein